MKTLLEVLKLSTEYLSKRKIGQARRISEEVFAHVLKMKRMDLYLQHELPIIEEEIIHLRKAIQRCGENEPVEYVIGMIDFFGCKIKTDPRALIPRQETEILVELISKYQPKGVLWDLCTGTGCIGIALKKAFPELRVILSDISKEALSLAKENALLNEVQVEFVQGDLLEPFSGKRADWIVCNPPYISESEYESLDVSVKKEPKLALVSGKTGVEFYERLQKDLANVLNPEGRAFFEIGSMQAQALQKLFPYGTIHLDWAGKPRFFIQ